MTLIGGPDWRASQQQQFPQFPGLGSTWGAPTQYQAPQAEASVGGFLGGVLGDLGLGGLGDVVGAVARVGLPIAAQMISNHNADRPDTARSLPRQNGGHQTAAQLRDQASTWDRIQEIIGVSDESLAGRAGDALTAWFTDDSGQVTNHPPGGVPGMANGMTLRHAEHKPMFRYRNSTAVGQRVIPVQNPMTGKTHFFGDLGTPLLFSRDFAAHKRVNKLARKASRGKPRSRKRR